MKLLSTYQNNRHRFFNPFSQQQHHTALDAELSEIALMNMNNNNSSTANNNLSPASNNNNHTTLNNNNPNVINQNNPSIISGSLSSSNSSVNQILEGSHGSLQQLIASPRKSPPGYGVVSGDEDGGDVRWTNSS